MRRETWVEVIRDFHEQELPELVEREVNVPIRLPIRRAVSIVGPRRVGKTFYMFQLVKKILSSGVERSRVLYVNLEDVVGVDVKELTVMLDVFYEMYPENKRRDVWLFLDEVQCVPGWESFVRRVLDVEKVQVFICGSSSKLLSMEVATSLRGRSITYHVLPFSFREFLRARGVTVERYLSSYERAKVLNALSSYLEWGGYPEVVLYPEERYRMVKEILDVTVYRDVVERYGVRNIKLLKLLLRALTSSTMFSVHRFHNFLKSQGVKASKNTIYNYLEYLADTMIIYPLRRYSPSYREAEQTMPKIYLIDNALLKVGGVENRGKLLENLILTELLRRKYYWKPELEIYYYKTPSGREVDFVVVEAGRVKQLIQACYSLEDFNTRERELKAIVKAGKDLGCRNLTILTWDEEGEEEYMGVNVKVEAVWRWLLHPNAKSA
ncbi:MAG: ATP-binding protein [Candidatus Freyarchaeota archaeon]